MKKLKENLWIIILSTLLLILLAIVVGLINYARPQDVKKIVVGALFIDGVDDRGWSESHYNGLKNACDNLGIALEVEENVSETLEDAEPAIDRLVGKGCSVIFLTSDGYDEKLYPVIQNYPDIEFYTVSPDSSPENVTTYFGRIYQIRFLAGILAGRMTKSNIIGYVAGQKSCQVNRGINAFALGARSVNPDVVVKVRFINSWTDAEKEKELATKLIEEDGADLITYHASIHTAVDAAEEHSAYSIGYNNNGTDYSEKYLASVNFNWGNLYKTLLHDFFNGDMYPGKYYWHGVVYGTVEMKTYSKVIPEEVIKEIDDRKEKLINVQDVFYGDLYSNDGTKKCSKGQRISDDALFRRMDWFVEGVEVYE
ncbi:basic membrane protein A [Butyrivibrio sp. ob235]|uniref:BMP family ABC transporter substrate-binding protein n=1 Tax=Butyrivibrio sp. ob235 TaxID=1761780 RepID=UPI0008B60A00|nr:BMP family ABC transporter substrate-binding protein [Butyrivibrio sp. ob235]SEL35503.1 basic membrane protein A [Butyrivibrio sp. ob235]